MAIKLVKGNSKSRDIFFNNLTTINSIQRVGKAIIVNFKNGDKYIYENFDILSKDTNFNNKSNFLDYINSLKDQKDILTTIVSDTSTLKDTDLLVLDNGLIDYVKNIDLSKLSNSKSIINDDSCVAYLPFDNNIKDQKGNFKPTIIGTAPKYIKGKFNQAILSQYTNSGNNQDTSVTQVKVGIVNKDSDIVTISAWLKWNKVNSVMPFGFKKYDIWFYNNWLGFNTSNGDIYGIDNNLDWTEFHHFVVEFHENEYGKLWIDGVEQNLTQKVGKKLNSSITIKNVDFHIFGWGINEYYRNFGAVDEVFIFNRALTNDEIQNLYKGAYVLRKLNI